MKIVLITDNGIERRECRKVEPSLKLGFLVIDEEYTVKVEDVMCIVEG